MAESDEVVNTLLHIGRRPGPGGQRPRTGAQRSAGTSRVTLGKAHNLVRAA